MPPSIADTVSAVQARGIDDGAGDESLVRRRELDTVGGRGRADERTANDHRDVVVLAEVFERLDQRLCFEDAGVGRPERGDGAHVRFLRLDEVGIDELHWDAVGVRLLPQRFEIRHFVIVGGDDQLSATRVRNAMLRTEVVEAIAPLDTQARLERAGRVVKAGVDHARVVRARGAAGSRIALEQAHRRAGLGKRQGRREPRHAAADHRHVDLDHPFVQYTSVQSCRGCPDRS